MYTVLSNVSFSRSYIVKNIFKFNNFNIVNNVCGLNLHSQFKSFDNVSNTIVKELCQNDPERENLLKTLMIEIDLLQRNGQPVPENIKLHQWQELMRIKSRKKRSKQLFYLFKKERKMANNQEKNEKPSLKRNKEYPDDHTYGLGSPNQSLFLRCRNLSIDNYYNYRALQSMLHSQPIIIDCSYDEHMVYREMKTAARQVCFLFSENRIHREPLNIHLCNVDLDGMLMENLRRIIPSIECPYFPLSIHTQDYLDIFPKEKLIYLTPHCKEELKTFNHDDIYIVGCMVDKVVKSNLSLAKAKSKGIRMAKLPLDRFLEFAPCAKRVLNINHMLAILADIRLTGDWTYSLRHVPSRFLMRSKFSYIQKQFAMGDVIKKL